MAERDFDVAIDTSLAQVVKVGEKEMLQLGYRAEGTKIGTPIITVPLDADAAAIDAAIAAELPGLITPRERGLALCATIFEGRLRRTVRATFNG